ncbi:hypothetical protein GCM10010915_13070 [Microbacterium faecale]|uniref:Ribose 1,5-bisphosphate phosphokinase PhnN n=1 Tax=Microbacterium faecale TaxID=1804630 RepID=A0A916Y7B1_9MICO|nr:phosphonate metabolism protein/1,5-bisphosphokinase (PRPP-forming) PhnN [Microbacterium faecale]GGD34059.1 hypothetical protein GCM10010915_13070 [Microbacterium faecale]
MSAPGCFVAVVGPSGAGKDTVLGAARDALITDERIHFVRRVITRPAGPGEDHEPTSAQDFSDAAQRGAFALTWRAHGLRYGIPRDVDAQLAAGSVVVANLSRAVVADARQRFARVAVIVITASAEVRLERIRARGREDLAAARARIARRGDAVDHDLEIVNDGTIAEAGDALARFLADRLAPIPS